MKQIILVENDRVGLLADISYILAKNKLNIENISVNVLGNKVVLVLTTNDIKKAASVLSESGYKTISEDFIAVKLDDTPGELNKITTMLADAGITIYNVSVLTRDTKDTIVALKVARQKKAREILKKYLVENEE
jgi:hypothetical protein